MFIRAKRVSDPLNDRVKACLLSNACYSSSGSEHEADSSSSLSSLLHEFFDFDKQPATNDSTSSDDITDDDSDGSRIAHDISMVQDFLDPSRNPNLHSDVVEAVEALSSLRSSSGSEYRRGVMGRLRDIGYNAGICKAKWESSGGLTAGSYEYIDILLKEERYIVDLDFGAQFEIARATKEYKKLASALPSVIVGKVEEVRRVVRIIAEAAKRSLKRKELSVPPWRKRRYMIAKWFGGYRRTVSPLQTSAGSAVAGRSAEVIQCRAVGFLSATPSIVAPLEGKGNSIYYAD